MLIHSIIKSLFSRPSDLLQVSPGHWVTEDNNGNTWAIIKQGQGDYVASRVGVGLRKEGRSRYFSYSLQQSYNRIKATL